MDIPMTKIYLYIFVSTIKLSHVFRDGGSARYIGFAEFIEMLYSWNDFLFHKLMACLVHKLAFIVD
jgi:hypothetical protein